MEWIRLLCDDRIRSFRKKNSIDLRSEFEKDYHRIIQSASFRRLQDKTQVFPLDNSDFIRTRLTHSLEVSSYGKSLGQSIGRTIINTIKDPTFLPEYGPYICDILQCAGLLHDIGNPPFGHFGEMVIRDWFRENLSKIYYNDKPLADILNEQMLGDFYNFEGNTQALRLVTKLHYLVDEYGMNLTKALLGTIIKYPVSSTEIDKTGGDICHKKMGYFYADVDTFRDIDRSLGLNGRRHPLAYALEAADDIAYLTADIEDAFKKGCLNYRSLYDELKKAAPRKSEPEYENMLTVLREKYEKAVSGLEHQPEFYALQNWMPRVQGHLLNCATLGFQKNYRRIMSGEMNRALIEGTTGERMAYALGDIAYRYAFTTKPILRIEIAADRILCFLLDSLVRAAVYFDTDKPMSAVQEKLMGLISDNYMAVYKRVSEGKSATERLYLRILLVTDEICGMTDSYAQRLYKELNGM